MAEKTPIWKRERARRPTLALGLVAVAAATASLGLAIAARAGADSKRSLVGYPRAQTLITTGTQWGNIAGFNPYFGAYAVGTVGLCYETLLRYDPLTDRYIDWLAESAGFTGSKTYTLVIRPGIKWADGRPFTPWDVAWNFRLGRFPNAFWHDLYSSLASIRIPGSRAGIRVRIKVKGKTKTVIRAEKVRNRVVFTFRGTPDYIQWQNLIWNLPLISPAQGRAIRGSGSFESFNPAAPVGTGPYELDPAGYDPTTRVVWKKKATWWATQQKLEPSPKPEYIMDVIENCGSLFEFPYRAEDLNNEYLPGIQRVVAANGLAHTYYSGPPYDLSANTSWLVPNTTHKPLDDPAFRRALATAININRIVADDYGHLVPAANATGLLPTWKKWIAADLVSKEGFSFDLARAKSLLQAAGYLDVNNDGYVENRDGSPINLSIAVPQGWSDWEEARDMIVADARAVGIHLTVKVGDFNAYQSARNTGTFDLVLDDTPQISDSPFTYFDYLFRLPVEADQTIANFGRYQNSEAWSLVQQLDRTPPSQPARRKAITRSLEEIFLTELPVIPLWNNGLWSQSESRYWTNWPSSDSPRRYTPSMWRGYMQMTAIDMIAHLQPGSSADSSGSSLQRGRIGVRELQGLERLSCLD